MNKDIVRYLLSLIVPIVAVVATVAAMQVMTADNKEAIKTFPDRYVAKEQFAEWKESTNMQMNAVKGSVDKLSDKIDYLIRNNKEGCK